MPVVSQIDRKSDLPIKKYIATADAYRLQLAALPDEKDLETGRMKKGRNLVAQFKGSFFETNIPNVIELVEDSYAFADGSIKDWDALQVEAKEKRYAELKKLVEEDSELLERLKGELVVTGSTGEDGEAVATPPTEPTEADIEAAKPKPKAKSKK